MTLTNLWPFVNEPTNIHCWLMLQLQMLLPIRIPILMLVRKLVLPFVRNCNCIAWLHTNGGRCHRPFCLYYMGLGPSLGLLAFQASILVCLFVCQFLVPVRCCVGWSSWCVSATSRCHFGELLLNYSWPEWIQRSEAVSANQREEGPTKKNPVNSTESK